jgi:hypothetical protein
MSNKHADPEEFMKSLAGVDFPTSRSAILNAARDKGGFDAEVVHVLEQVADRTYEDADDLTAEVRRIYARGGGLRDAGPAALAKTSDDQT